jgi:hypothetical protein
MLAISVTNHAKTTLSWSPSSSLVTPSAHYTHTVFEEGQRTGWTSCKKGNQGPPALITRISMQERKGGWWRQHRIKNFKEAHTSMMAVPKLSTQLTKAGFCLPY